MGRSGFWSCPFGTSETPNASLSYSDSLPEFTAYDAHFFAICDDTVESHAETVNDLGLDFPLVVDPNGEVSGWLLNWARDAVLIAFILDPNQRVATIIHGSKVGHGGFTERVFGDIKPDRPYNLSQSLRRPSPIFFAKSERRLA